VPVDVKLLKPEDAKVLLSTKPLGDPAVGPSLVDAVVAADQSFAGKAITVSLGGTLSIRAFNSADDEDEDGVLGEPSDEAPGGALAPQLRLTSADAFVKYRCAATVKATAAGTALSSLGFDFEGSAELVLADYQRHPRTADTRTAVLRGLTALRSSLRLADVLDELRPNEAVSQQLLGRLSAGVEVSWADVFSGPIGPVARLAGTATPFLVKVSAGATLSARVSLTDDFILVFARESDDRWRVGVRKARTRDAAIGLDLGVDVQLDRTQLEAVVGAVIDGVLGERLARVEALVASGGALESLPDAQQKLAHALLDRFGLSATPTLEAVRERVAAIKAGVAQAVAEVARAKLSAGFAYEYRRVRQDTTIAQCVLTRAGLTAHHPELVRGNIGPTLADAAAGVNGASLERFLNEKRLRTERSWGFSLSIGKWQAGSRDTKTITRVERTSAAGLRQHSFLGVRAYAATGEPKPKWSVDFAAEMPAFSRSLSGPLMSEFQYGLSFAWFEDTKKLKDDTLDEWLDLAVLWGACTESELPRHRETLAEALKKKCSIVAQLTLPPEAFGIVRERVAAAEATELGASLGAAMPWMNLAGRQSVALRRRLYGPLWASYLADPDHMHRSGRDFSQAARQHLGAQGFEPLGNLERMYQITPTRSGDPLTFAGSIDLQPSTIQNCHDFFNGVRLLQTNVLSAAPAAHVMGRVFEQMEELFGQHLHVRALGGYLLEVARATGVLRHTGRSLAFTVAGEKDAAGQVFVIAS
jgi:hypothetical protein